MQRFDVLYWYTGQGSPKSENTSPPITFSSAGASPAPAPAPQSASAPKILITEIQIEHPSSTDYDFIELYNSNSEHADISDFQLKKRNSAGNEDSVRVFPEGSVVQSKGYFLWANSDYAASGLILANAAGTQTLAKNNSLALLDKNKNNFWRK